MTQKTGAIAAERDLVTVVRAALADLESLPPYKESPDHYTDWGTDGEFRVHIGQGECAG